MVYTGDLHISCLITMYMDVLVSKPQWFDVCNFLSSKRNAVIRASDDFWPRDPASHTIHIASVAYNSLFLGEFMQPDWDMFHVRTSYCCCSSVNFVSDLLDSNLKTLLISESSSYGGISRSSTCGGRVCNICQV